MDVGKRPKTELDGSNEPSQHHQPLLGQFTLSVLVILIGIAALVICVSIGLNSSQVVCQRLLTAGTIVGGAITAVGGIWITIAQPSGHNKIKIAAVLAGLVGIGGLISTTMDQIKDWCPTGSIILPIPHSPNPPTKSAGIYVIGGKLNSGQHSSFVHRIDPRTNSVYSYPLQYRGRMNAAFLANDTIVLSSYWGDWTGYATYSTLNNTVTTVANVPNIEVYGAAAALAGNMYTNCGWNGSDINKCVLMDITSGNYKTMDIGEKKAYGCAVAINNTHVLWIGGWTNSVLLVNTVTANYTEVTKMKQSRTGHSCSLFGTDTVVICGGKLHAEFDSTCVSLSVRGWWWGTFPSMQSKRYGLKLVQWASKLWAIGGGSDVYLSSIEVFDGAEWLTSSLKLPTPLAWFGAAVVPPYLPNPIPFHI